ncbi:MAG: hypothetical protein OXN23_06320 [Gammaproteobacteria bacterium]|nr:hypothetical protein [Gammaproteobacteria bacterium]MDE0303021.1 hypothetical protein [Gammaproteobacteria bacterium]MDE0612026.1 hypothetical protein [Gammaproteobacteria bacterium]
MSVIQTGYSESMQPVNPEAQSLPVRFILDSGVHSMEPVKTASLDYPEHTVLLDLTFDQSRGQGSAHVVADPRVPERMNQILLSLRPEDARKLVCQLQKIVDSN